MTNTLDDSNKEKLIFRVAQALSYEMSDLEVADSFSASESPEDIFLSLHAAKILNKPFDFESK